MMREGGYAATGFGARLRTLRVEKGLTQAAVAGAAAAHVNTIAKLERGLQEPAWPLVLALADALGVCVSAFRLDPAETLEVEPARRGRPRKEPVEEPAPKKRGRPRKEAGPQTQDAHEALRRPRRDKRRG